MAAALADEDGEVVGAIHVHGPSYRFPEAEGSATGATGSAADRALARDRSTAATDRIAADVVAAAARVSRSLRRAG